MRTEVKAGAIVGLVAILVLVFVAVNRGSGQKDKIDFDVKPKPGQPAQQLETLAERPRDSARRPGEPAARPGPATPVSNRPSDRGVSPAGTPPGPTTRRTDEVRLPPIVGPTEGGGAPRASTAPATPPAGDRPIAAAPGADRPAGALTPTTAPLRPRLSEPAGPTTRPADEPVTPRGPGVALPPRTTEPAAPTGTRSNLVRETPRPEQAGQRYTVKAGDTLSSIAEEYLGDARLWPRIAEANPGLDPDRLREGQVLQLPSRSGPAGSPAAGARPAAPAATPTTRPASAAETYVVKADDSLISIAREILGDRNRWREIWELNKDQIPDPDKIVEGLRLKLPPRNRPAERPPAGATTRPR